MLAEAAAAVAVFASVAPSTPAALAADDVNATDAPNAAADVSADVDEDDEMAGVASALDDAAVEGAFA